jgi:hypothetical protein
MIKFNKIMQAIVFQFQSMLNINDFFEMTLF